MEKSYNPIIMGFPLRGEWSVPNTPGSRIPSHGTNVLGTRFAYDFLQVDRKRRGGPCYSNTFIEYLLMGVPVSNCYCYGRTIYAPCDGIVIKAEDNYPERAKARIFSDLHRAGENSKFDVSKEDVKKLTGNYIILKHSESVYAAFCHLKPDSFKVSEGQSVKKGDILGGIGHTGNSIFPHLHFQLMDSPDMTATKGLPCAFEQYELFQNGKWTKVYNGIPKSTDRIRYIE